MKSLPCVSKFVSIVSLALLVCGPIPLCGEERTDKALDYNRDVRPILSNNCFFCHGPDAGHRQADLRLDDETSAKEFVLIPGEPDQSQMFARIVTDDADILMPPPESGKKLTPSQVDILRRWIQEGAQYDAYWAYVPPQHQPTPSIDDDQWSEGSIDRFILRSLHAERLQPSPTADRVTLARRLSFDLTGLPPTVSDVDTFVNDHRSDAYERYVDRLLASPNYGERMAAYWLDLVRFANTVGYHGDQDHHISPYRDYVIDAFNTNTPFDQFTREQIAGDLLPSPTLSQRIATGYNRLLQTTHEGGLQPKEYRAIYAADRVRNLSVVWMGATVGCAQCHDHKYDPYTIKDFYSLAAFFADIDDEQHFTGGNNALPTKRAPEIVVLSNDQQREIELIEQQIEQLQSEQLQSEQQPTDKPSDLDEQVKALKAKIADIEKQGRRTMVTVPIRPRETRVLPRGNWLDESGEIVQPAIPQFIGQIAAQTARADRLDLANWLTDCESGNGLQTARVMANRIWYLFMGRGISKSLDDFGGQGEPPEHPELLDQLALQWAASDWDLKHLIRQIVLSKTYRQTTQTHPDMRQRDPYNRLFARQTSYRLSAEMIRDAALTTSGLLVDRQGGESVKPYQPAGYYQHLNFPLRKYRNDTDERQWRRGIYVHWQRQFLHPTLKAFDAPSREECTAERPRSNTPLAALALLNDPSFVEAARALASRALTDSSSDDESRMNRLCRLVLSRDADSYERTLLLQLLDQNRSVYEKDPDAAKKLLSIGLASVDNSIAATEWAAWTMVARTLLNMDEAITRN